MNTATTYQIEGNLIGFDLTTELISGDLKGQASPDFKLSKTQKLEDEIAIAWGYAKAYWTEFQVKRASDETDTATSTTREVWAVRLLKLLGYEPTYQAKAEIVEGQTFAISHRAETGEDKPPIHIIGSRLKLEQRAGTPRLSAHALMQEYLNCTEHLWGVITNGLQWRLLRDCSLMTRLSYIEFDLEQILSNENYSEFGLFYRLFHRTRLPEGMDDCDKCLLEFYHQQTLQQGGRVRDRLRDGVEEALKILGTGFLQHPKNQFLRDQVAQGELCEKDYYRQLLLLIYRLLFLMVAESRNMLLIGEDEESARIYNEYYSVERLRALAERPIYGKEGFQDKWQGLLMTFRLFDENWRGEKLGLSPLNGDLFGSSVLTTLEQCGIDNYDLLRGIKNLSLYVKGGQLRRVNYAALDVEELGSIYESLLDFAPKFDKQKGDYCFKLVTGSDRKTTGSYYTPPELVAQLIKTALEPVIEERLKEAETQAEQVIALLNLTVCDPACGSGHFLLAAARRIGKELAKVRTGESQPGVEPIREAIRDVIQHCIYGVDLNPLAVDLCKVALWIEGFNRGKPLSFLDHRIKCGNSLVGVLDLDCLEKGIPDNAYKAVTGDDKKLATQIKKENKKQCKNKDQFVISFDNLEEQRSHYGKEQSAIAQLPENKTGDIKQKQQQYRNTRKETDDNPWWRDTSACNLWTAAFFTPLTEQKLQLLPTSSALFQLLQGNPTTQKIVDAANDLAKQKRFFHWALEFPDVFENGGFSCVLGNPPWERIKLQEKEFFATKDSEIANAKNKAARTKLINKLATTNPQLLAEFEDAKHDADATSKFLRESGRFLLSAVGDINTYAVFTETTKNIISKKGLAGIIIPTGIATDSTTSKLFRSLIKTKTLKTLIGFKNSKKIFKEIKDYITFCLFVINGSSQDNNNTSFSWLALNMKQADDPRRKMYLEANDLEIINPNTLTCPIFRTFDDAELTKKIYRNSSVIENEKTGNNPWSISFMTMFHMSSDSDLFKNKPGENLLPLYEAKMFWNYDHRYSTYEGATQANLNEGNLPQLTPEMHSNPNIQILPRYWVNKKFVEDRIAEKTSKKWLISFRDITGNASERTSIFSILPIAAVGHSASILLCEIQNINLIACLFANFCSLTFDFIARQKVGGIHMSFYIFKQLPVISPETYTEEDIKFISSRVLKLVYTAWDTQPFAKDMDYEGEPFIWDEQRRAILRAELDAYYAKLYGLTRDELRYILDPADVYGEDFPSETFRVLKNNEIKKYGEYRTQRLVLKAWDRLFG